MTVKITVPPVLPMKQEPTLTPYILDTRRPERAPKKLSAALAEPVSEDSLSSFHRDIADHISNAYCDGATFAKLLRRGQSMLGLDARRVHAILSMALERLHAVNEQALLDELDALLHVCTDAEKKIDKKERIDALQTVCKARPGVKKGMDPAIAERFITDFCRRNSVRERSGLWGWKVL
ncbi:MULTISPECIES: hypothetical protein [unclassified Janthinobacterium]|uniref:hypothetical protein n=1 Tax=unclassified Janthinobacterium TaxID=2610881 RepID=UPI0016122F3E|nr:MULTISPECIES: hypothetical protein [unclassified Janthinobacterium]MBB5367673.1 hypothetical protein [Janthinobacterium sp. K2C7]MBB5379849.1 hypothetical protein [Janthinobacterium sp. K2Li3]MBB5386055.1 hypothetical protein [Janthinobacterium sp. K2E3]